ncbi:DUF373 family protein [Sulfuracidifex metallicus]|uniref:DUF373 family protein n=1 Tax=Sulfuracidifex metallicus TaxID=47303 RepID=UPI002276BEB1|nr:DUF373 family protein [Sulfuracidifex metallicus]MCY0849576.1 DUF373 family protein [Sulfuracidifex metallicus]
MARTIVIYIDIDDDLGEIGIETPVIGEEAVRKAIDTASEYMVYDSDFNSMVAAFNTYKRLKREGEDVEIVFIAGSNKSELEAQLAFSSKIDDVIEKLHPDQAIVVYDSPEDAKAIPIVQSRIKISAIEQVIVEQHRGVEETYMLIGRYLKRAFSEEKFSRIFLGVPGLIFVLVGIFSLLDLSYYIGPVILATIGVAMIIRGLRIDEQLEKWWENSVIMVITSVISIISVIIGLVSLDLELQSIRIMTLNQGIYIVLGTLLPYFTFSIVVLFSGKAISKAVYRDIRIWHDLIKVVSTIFLYYVIFDFLNEIIRNQFLGGETLFTLAISSAVIISSYIALSFVEKSKFTKTG